MARGDAGGVRLFAEGTAFRDASHRADLGRRGARPVLFPRRPRIARQARKRFDEADFAGFLELLPRQIEGRRIRNVIEARHASFAAPACADLLRRHGVALAMVDDAKYPGFDAVTADFRYLRLRRCTEDEPTGYPPVQIDQWAERLRGWAAEGMDCFCYFINGAKVRAPAAAQALIERLG